MKKNPDEKSWHHDGLTRPAFDATLTSLVVVAVLSDSLKEPESVACFACGIKTRHYARVDTRDSQIVEVGMDCYYHVHRAGELGYQPPKGGPRLWRLKDSGEGNK